ncbi:hypothetical protein ACNKHV_02065 [Shigella flexneri]
MLIVVIVIGLLYALPNLFGAGSRLFRSLVRAESPPVKITLIHVSKTLQEGTTVKSVALEEGAILARFDSTDTQLRAREH